jgi:H+-translocating NAD(P) transhydrogenase subunit alpha
MMIGVPKESAPLERRVALTPDGVKKAVQLGYQVSFERGCGVAAHFSDEAFVAAGATPLDPTELWSQSDLLIKVQPPASDEVARMKSGSAFIGFLWPGKNKEIVDQLAAKSITAIGMDCIPRISRAQKMDALSSMANIAGYRAVIEAANEFGGLFTGQITAAGKMPPAKVLVIGAGVAGLAAIGAAGSLGAIVRAFDTRAAVKEQVQSMGAEFLELEYDESGDGAGGYAKEMSQAFYDAEMKLFAAQAEQVDIIVTTALIPGKPAPKLIPEWIVKKMRPGSIIVDMAAEQGGNCECTEPGERAVKHGVIILGYTDLTSRLATQSSRLYSNNVLHLLSDLTPAKNGTIQFDVKDDIVRCSMVTSHGKWNWPPAPIEPSPTGAKPSQPTPSSAVSTQAKKGHGAVDVKLGWVGWTVVVAVALLFLALGTIASDQEFLGHVTVFILSCLIGWQVIWNVTPALHTPLMSVTNAISGIILVGAILQVKGFGLSLSSILAAAAILLATINISGGFLVTHRMLLMFRKQE